MERLSISGAPGYLSPQECRKLLVVRATFVRAAVIRAGSDLPLYFPARANRPRQGPLCSSVPDYALVTVTR